MFNRPIYFHAPCFLLAAWMGCGELSLKSEVDFAEPLRVINSVSREGQGNAEAFVAMQTLVFADAKSIPIILAAMASSNEVALNWLRAAVETIAQRHVASGKPFPFVELGKFVLETSNPPRARRLAFELISKVDPLTSDRLLTGMVNDPSPELRREAVQKLIQQANLSLSESNKVGATLLFQQLLSLARDVDQVDGIAKSLRNLGQVVDLPFTLGFLTQWKVAGPFDSIGGKGFAAVYPPEAQVDLAADYDGKTGKVRWQRLLNTEEDGSVSMNKPYTPLKGVAAYAYSEFYSENARVVDLRLGSKNAFKVWLNGQFLFGQEEYHRNKAIDQYRMTGQLKSGRNIILVKVCQNEQTEDWATEWDFQLRVCDALGTPIRSVAAASGGDR